MNSSERKALRIRKEIAGKDRAEGYCRVHDCAYNDAGYLECPFCQRDGSSLS